MTFLEWCKCIDPEGPYGRFIARLEARPEASDPTAIPFQRVVEIINELRTT